MIEAASLNITENRLEGVIDDPQFEDGMFDLSSTMLLTTEVRVETESRLRLRMFSAIPFSFGGNEILIFLGKPGSVWFVNATLFQWADFNAYDGKFARRLPVLSGILTVK